MSIKCVSWALNHAPVDEPVEVLILVAMAERANEDGTDTYQSIATIAKKSRVSSRTVHRKLKELSEAGLIRVGDQRSVEHFPSNRRPVVYDLAIEKIRGDNLSPVTEEPSSGDIQAVSGDIQGASAVTRMADNPSLDPSLDNPSLLEPSARKRAAHVIPAGIELTPELRRYAKDKLPPGLDPELEFELFVNHHKRNGTRAKDWDASWRTWVLHAVKFERQRRGGVFVGPASVFPQKQPTDNGMKLGLNYDDYADNHRA